ncbi:hypothetical protein [Lacicoccus qingdaonensis]|uniref:Uncharacterized protein n=1 Tax=Lacicoccus qingdaonensis TaxID=576118 RepID=A0A1G9B993_9BACL|nr:hypothetical protein [Salinicoccus qingdaonensis]SDK36146.1 hypothetical protein SAMN05216216_102170 [Salinicoccus qingdaonensis]
MFASDRYSADLKIKEYKTIAMNNAKLDNKKKTKKSFVGRLVSIINL